MTTDGGISSPGRRSSPSSPSAGPPPDGARDSSTVPRPAAARITVTRFMRFGPAPSSPRRPAVPNSSLAPNRSASASGSSGRVRSSARVSGSGSCSSHSSARALSLTTSPSQASDELAEQPAHARGGGAAGLQHLLVVQRPPGEPGGDVRHEGDTQNLGPAL